MILRLLVTQHQASSHQVHYRYHLFKVLQDPHKDISEAGLNSTTKTLTHASQLIPVVRWAPRTIKAACSRPH